MSGKKIAHTTEACHEAWPTQECHHGATRGPNRCGSTPDTARTQQTRHGHATPLRHRRAGELSIAFADLDVIAAGKGWGEAWLLARARRAAPLPSTDRGSAAKEAALLCAW